MSLQKLVKSMIDLYPIENADYFEIDFYIGRKVIRTERFKYIEDLKEALQVPLDERDCILAIPYTVYVENDNIVRFPFDPHCV